MAVKSENLQLLDDERKRVSGLNVGMTVFLLAGELIGTGVVTLPYSMVTSGESAYRDVRSDRRHDH